MAAEQLAATKRARLDVDTMEDDSDPISLMQKSVKQLSESCNVVLPDHERKIKRLEQKAKSHENYSRSYNLIIDGLPAEFSVDRLTLCKHLMTLLNDTVVTIDDEKLVLKDFDDAHRVNSRNGSDDHPTVLVRFVSKKYPSIIMNNRGLLKAANEERKKNNVPPLIFALDYEAECAAEKRFLLVVRHKLCESMKVSLDSIKVYIANGDAYLKYYKDGSAQTLTATTVPDDMLKSLNLTRFVAYSDRQGTSGRGRGSFRGRGGGRHGRGGRGARGGGEGNSSRGSPGGRSRGGGGGRGRGGGNPRGGRNSSGSGNSFDSQRG